MTRSDLPFLKYHALGNDYFVMDPLKTPFEVDGKFVKRLCDRHRGAGSDGLLLGPLEPGEPFRLRIFNPDGGEAQRSGNGLRIFAQYLKDAGYIQGDQGLITTSAGEVRATFLPGGLIEVDLGEPSFLAGDLPFTGVGPQEEILAFPLVLEGETVAIHGVSVGNPHAVVLAGPSTPGRARRLGPQIEHHPLFPERVNVQFVEVINRSTLRIEIWERGAGYTQASGTSSSAVAAVCRRRGLVGDEVEVRMPGGSLRVRFQGERILLAGPVSHVFEGIWPQEASHG